MLKRINQISRNKNQTTVWTDCDVDNFAGLQAVNKNEMDLHLVLSSYYKSTDNSVFHTPLHHSARHNVVKTRAIFSLTTRVTVGISVFQEYLEKRCAKSDQMCGSLGSI